MRFCHSHSLTPLPPPDCFELRCRQDGFQTPTLFRPLSRSGSRSRCSSSGGCWKRKWRAEATGWTGRPPPPPLPPLPPPLWGTDRTCFRRTPRRHQSRARRRPRRPHPSSKPRFFFARCSLTCAREGGEEGGGGNGDRGERLVVLLFDLNRRLLFVGWLEWLRWKTGKPIYHIS